MTLTEAFSRVKDPRRAEGRRTTIEQILSMVTISYMCGYVGYRGVGAFCKSYQQVFTEELGLKHAVPSHVTFRDVLMRVKERDLIDAFHNWTKDHVKMDKGDIISGDGKSLKSTLNKCHSETQDFQCIVSLFCQKTGLVSQISTYRNKKKSEIEVVLEVIKSLKKNGLIIRLDALHTQKND